MNPSLSLLQFEGPIIYVRYIQTCVRQKWSTTEIWNPHEDSLKRALNIVSPVWPGGKQWKMQTYFRDWIYKSARNIPTTTDDIKTTIEQLVKYLLSFVFNGQGKQWENIRL